MKVIAHTQSPTSDHAIGHAAPGLARNGAAKRFPPVAVAMGQHSQSGGRTVVGSATQVQSGSGPSPTTPLVAKGYAVPAYAHGQGKGKHPLQNIADHLLGQKILQEAAIGARGPKGR